MEQVDWNKWLTLIAALTLVTAVVIPWGQKKYEEYKARTSFELYIKKYLGVLFNILTYDKIEYIRPSIKDQPEKSHLSLTEFIRQFEIDFKEHQNTTQTRVAFSVLFNLQNLYFVLHRLRTTIQDIDIHKLYDNTLAYGNYLSKDKLNKIYGLLLLVEHFFSITAFHDRFVNLQSIKRQKKNEIWIGLSVDNSLLANEQIVAGDMKHLCDNELSIDEVAKATKLLIQEIKSFYDYEKLMKKRDK